MGLLTLLRKDEQSEIDNAWKRYAELLESDSPEPKAVAETKRVMLTLGKTADDATLDAVAIATARRLQATIAQGTGLEDQTAVAVEAARKFREETDRIAAARVAEQLRLEDAYEVLERAYSGGMRATYDLQAHLARHPNLLRHAAAQ